MINSLITITSLSIESPSTEVGHVFILDTSYNKEISEGSQKSHLLFPLGPIELT